MGIAIRGVLAKKMKSAAFRKEYDKLATEFSIARMLIAARGRAGLTQVELAQKMGTTQSAIARLESGKRMPSVETLESYAEATGCRLQIKLIRAA